MQRIGLARALFKKPVFIVLDEPNSNLDDAGEQALAQSLLKMRERKATAVIVTHRMSALKTATKMLVMQDGKVLKFGPTQTVLEELNKARQAHALVQTQAAV